MEFNPADNTLTAVDPNMPSVGPATNTTWPSLPNFLSRWETISIQIDSLDGNGYVTDWSRNNASHVQSHINHARVDVSLPNIWRYIEGQGDIFKRSASNKVYIKVYNSGEGASIADSNGISLYARNHGTNTWDLLGSESVPVISPNSEELISFELAPDTLVDMQLENFGQPSWNVWTADFRVEIKVNQNEKHTNNNVSTEKVFVIL